MNALILTAALMGTYDARYDCPCEAPQMCVASDQVSTPKLAPVRRTVRFFQARKPVRKRIACVLEEKPVRKGVANALRAARDRLRERPRLRRLRAFVFGRGCR